MKKSPFTEEQIAYALKQAELGTAVGEICRRMGIAEAEEPSADMDALAYIEGYSAVAMESVGTRGIGEVASERA
jgi:hypothetical protein